MTGRHCSGAILAGGSNTRFGGLPKGLAEVGGRRILDRVVDELRDTVDETFLITRDAAVAGAVHDIRVYPDHRLERASLVGVHSALLHCREAVLVVAWDMPFVSSALLSCLRARGEASGAPVLPSGARGLEPLCAYYPRAVLAVAEQQLDRGELRLSAFLAALPTVVTLSPNDVAAFGRAEQLFMNINGPADLAAARSLYRGDDARASATVATAAIDSERR